MFNDVYHRVLNAPTSDITIGATYKIKLSTFNPMKAPFVLVVLSHVYLISPLVHDIIGSYNDPMYPIIDPTIVPWSHYESHRYRNLILLLLFQYLVVKIPSEPNLANINQQYIFSMISPLLVLNQIPSFESHLHYHVLVKSLYCHHVFLDEIRPILLDY